MRVVGVVIDIDGRRVIFESTHIDGLLAHAQRPLVVEFILDVEKIGVVKQLRKPLDGDNTLTEEIGNVVADVAAEQEVEVVATEAVMVLCDGAASVSARWID